MRVTFICSYNLVRSPVAAAVLEKWSLGQHLGEVHINSAGTRATDGTTVPKEVLWAATKHDLAVRQHRARVVDKPTVLDSDLVVCMTESQRRAITTLAPRAFRNTFTLRELLRLTANGHPPFEAVADLAAFAHHARPFTTGPDEPEDVIDVKGTSAKAYQAVVDEVVALTTALSERLAVTPR